MTAGVELPALLQLIQEKVQFFITHIGLLMAGCQASLVIWEPDNRFFMKDQPSKDYLLRKLRFLPLPLQEVFILNGQLKRFPAGTTLLREGQYVSAIPLVLEGRLKVYAEAETKRLLLYYIRPEESCVMSFTARAVLSPK